MIHTIKIDDKTPTGKRLIDELRKYHKVVIFEKPSQSEGIQEGYMTGDEFFSGIKEELKRRSQDNAKVKEPDFWETMLEEQKQEVEKGLSEIVREDTVEYESVMKKHRK